MLATLVQLWKVRVRLGDRAMPRESRLPSRFDRRRDRRSVRPELNRLLRLPARRPTTLKKVAAPARRHEPTTTAKAAGRKRSSSNLGDQILALATGKTQQEIAAACKGARPNHVGAALARHKRAGLIEERDGKLYAIPSTRTDQPAAL